ncbi:MAG: SET domain-containing protein [Tepidiformaceae bacterium]
MPTYPRHIWADPRLESRLSPLGGVGGFATEPIPAGDTLLVLGGIPLTQAEMERTLQRYIAAGVYFNSLQVEESLHLHLEDVLPVPFNHSCDSNAWMADAVTVVARRDVAAGEELTVDYALQTVQPVPLLEVPCACGSLVCRGKITGVDWRIPALQGRYAGHFAPFINVRIAALSSSPRSD